MSVFPPDLWTVALEPCWPFEPAPSPEPEEARRRLARTAHRAGNGRAFIRVATGLTDSQLDALLAPEETHP